MRIVVICMEVICMGRGGGGCSFHAPLHLSGLLMQKKGKEDLGTQEEHL